MNRTRQATATQTIAPQPKAKKGERVMNMTRTSKAKSALTAMLSLAALICLSNYAQASLIVNHSGATDPENEGWSLAGAGANTSTTALSPDSDTGKDAWQTDDSGDSYLEYSFDLSASQVTDAKNKGWEMVATVRLPTDGQTVDEGVSFDVTMVDKLTYRVILGTSGGDTVVKLGGSNNPADVTTLAGSDYHEYAFVSDGAGTVDFLIDGSTEVANVSTISSGKLAGFFRFGSLSSADTGTGNWNQVEFTIIPEPASALLLALGAVALLKRRPRR